MCVVRKFEVFHSLYLHGVVIANMIRKDKLPTILLKSLNFILWHLKHHKYESIYTEQTFRSERQIGRSYTKTPFLFGNTY